MPTLARDFAGLRPATGIYEVSKPLITKRNHMPNSNGLHASIDLIMKAVILCDDFSLFAKAYATLQRMGCRSDVNAQWTIKSWPINVLSQACKAEKTLVEAADTHLVIIPARHARSLPFWLRDWLQRWAALRQIEDAALAVIGDCADAGLTNGVSPELTLFIRKHGLKLITEEGVVKADGVKLPVRFSLGRELSLPVEPLRVAYAMTCDAYRGFGINE